MAINAVDFLSALDTLEAEKGISKEKILESLKEAMMKGFRKQLGGDDAYVRVDIDTDKGTIEMYQMKEIVEEVEDDFLQISLEDAKKQNKSYNVGDFYLIPANIDDLKKATALTIKSVLKQKFAEAEKAALYEVFKDKIGTMIIGKVEKVDERGLYVNVGRTSVFLPRNHMIGDEIFMVGDSIKLYVSDVGSNTKGAQISVSRANEGFLRCLFEEEYQDIIDGTIVIKNVARRSGERCKVALYSNDPNIDAAGSCIGPNGSKVQKVVGQLGNGINKEKIDVINWHENDALFIIEAIKPAQALGLIMEDGSRHATIVVNDDQYSVAIGRRGVNVFLAAKITGYRLDIKTLEDVLEEGLTYKTVEQITSEDIEERARIVREQQLELLRQQQNKETVLPGLPEGYVAPQERVYEEETSDMDDALLEQSENEEIIIEEEKVVEQAQEVVEQEVKEEIVETECVKEEVTKVETTTTLEDLEKELEKSTSKQNKKSNFKKFKKNNKEEEKEELSPISSTDPSQYMSIYTEDELRELEEEDYEEYDDYEDEDIDYDEYDEYYDDDNM